MIGMPPMRGRLKRRDEQATQVERAPGGPERPLSRRACALRRLLQVEVSRELIGAVAFSLNQGGRPDQARGPSLDPPRLVFLASSFQICRPLVED